MFTGTAYRARLPGPKPLGQDSRLFCQKCLISFFINPKRLEIGLLVFLCLLLSFLPFFHFTGKLFPLIFQLLKIPASGCLLLLPDPETFRLSRTLGIFFPNLPYILPLFR